jgi:hypothetical protein
MRYFLTGFILLVIAIVSIAGFRGSISPHPPLEAFPDMYRQLKLRPQSEASFFADNRSSRLPVAGTIAVGTPFDDVPVNTGFEPGTTNWVDLGPLSITPRFLARGRERYDIYCAPCHGGTGDGKGITTRFGMAIVANLHDPRIVRMPDGELFAVITHGRNLMGAYGSVIAIEDRWAIISYLRVLHRSRLGLPEDVPADQQNLLPPPATPPAPAEPAEPAPDQPTQN